MLLGYDQKANNQKSGDEQKRKDNDSLTGPTVLGSGFLAALPFLGHDEILPQVGTAAIIFSGPEQCSSPPRFG
jgi:hypothetical protein